MYSTQLMRHFQCFDPNSSSAPTSYRYRYTVSV